MTRYERLGDSEEECLISYPDINLVSSSSLSPSSLPLLVTTTPTTRRPSIVQRILQSSRGVWSLRATSHRSTHVKVLRLLWCLALLSGEHVIYWAMIHRCSWPENEHWNSTHDIDRYRVAVLADPQLTDWYSYKQTGWLLTLVQTYTDLFMRRSFTRLHSTLRPDAVLFLGDLNDGGRETVDEEVRAQNRARFMERIFQSKYTAWNQEPVVVPVLDGDASKKEEGDSETNNDNNNKVVNQAVSGPRYRVNKNIPSTAQERNEARRAGKSVRLYVAGNHDIGYGNNLIHKMALRFKQDFGALNYEIHVGNHMVVVLDTLSLSAEDPAIRKEAQMFLDQIGQETPTLPRILFTHVPLFRLDTTYCGRQRETSRLIINEGGPQYWNMVNPTLSREILDKIKPDMVFSGDDHDWCEIGHTVNREEPVSGAYETGEKSERLWLAPEVTIPTFSFAQGIFQPGFVMLSLYNPNSLAGNNFSAISSSSTGLPAAIGADSSSGYLARPSGASTFEYEACMLPNQLRIYFVYIGLFALSVGWILFERYRWMARGEFGKMLRFMTEKTIYDDEEKWAGMPEPLGSTTATKMSSSSGRHSEDDEFEIRIEKGLDSLRSLPHDGSPRVTPQTQVSRDDVHSGTMRRPSRTKGGDGSASSPAMQSLPPPMFEIFPSSSTSPLLSSLFWKTVGWDLGHVVMVAVPLYAVLFLSSML
ncbi:hypothetical protein BGZ52_003908 [Haplosporangium bisporale]|nr:hypothetical protein BGZ52_003908 [Haplosporangium bisporale]KAF9207485.1 hypothetical protein BGZ59_011123 [Podila verticillata]KFH70018.1 hypothetical protein MVEG_04821 [Podila verticillata NRRL 6337]